MSSLDLWFSQWVHVNTLISCSFSLFDKIKIIYLSKLLEKIEGGKKNEVKLFPSPRPYLRGCHGLAALLHWKTQFGSGGPPPTAILSGDPLPFLLSPKKGNGFLVLPVLRTVPSLVVSPIPYHTFINKLYIKLYSVITFEGAFCFLLGKCWLTNSGVIQLPGSNYFSKC